MAKYKKYVLIASPSRNSEFNNLEAMAQIKANRYQDLPQACRDIQRILGHDAWKLYELSKLCEDWNDDTIWESSVTYASVVHVKRIKTAKQ